MDTRPKISVCIPSYNGERFIQETIDSVFSQTFTNYELLVVDDHSVDHTLEKVERYKDRRLRIVRHARNSGPESNWNAAVSEARGEYIKLLHDDDVLHPECLAKQLDILEQKEFQDVAMVSCKRRIVNQAGLQLMIRGMRKSGKIPGKVAIKETARAGTNLIGEPSAVLMRTRILRETGGFNGSIPYIIDLDLWFRLLLKGDLYMIPEPLCDFRISSSSWSSVLRKQQRQDFNEFITKSFNDGRYGLTAYDLVLSRTTACFNTLARGLFSAFASRLNRATIARDR